MRYDFGVAGRDHLVGEVDRVDPRETHLVDGGGGNRHRDPGRSGGLARGDLTRAAEQHLAHEHVVDLFGIDAGALERGLDRQPTEVGGAESRESAGELSDRRAGRSDDHGSGHGAS